MDEAAEESVDVRTFVAGLSAREREHDAVRAGWTPLHAAALRGDTSAVTALLSAGAAVDAIAAPPVVHTDAVSVTAAEARYGVERWGQLTRERDGIDAARRAATSAHSAADERVSEAEADLAAATEALQQAYAEEKAALDEALKSAEDAVARAEGMASGVTVQEEEVSKAEAKQKYLADAHYREAAQAEEELENISEALLRALAGLSAQELREHLEQLRTVDPEAGVHRSESVWSFRFHEKRKDLDTLTGQARILGVDSTAIAAVTDGDMRDPAATTALARLICAQLAHVEPAKAQHRAEKLQAKTELEYLLSLARRRAKSRREKAETLGKQFLKADAAYERARGMQDQHKQQVQALRAECKRLHDLAQSLHLKHAQPEGDERAESRMGSSELSVQPPSVSRISVDSIKVATIDAEHRRKLKSLHKLMGEIEHSKQDAASALAAAGGNLQLAAQSWLQMADDVACSFSEMRQHRLPRQRSQSKVVHVEPELGPEPAPQMVQDMEKSGKEHKGPDNYKRQGLLDLITTSRSRGLYPPKSMDLGFPAVPIKPPSAPTSAPPWMNAPSARTEFARNRLWRQTWDKAVGVGDPAPIPQGVSAGLWSDDLPDEDRHDLIRNLLMGILQVRYGYEKVKPDITCGDFLERSILVARDEIVRGVRPIAPEILASEGQERETKLAEAEAQTRAGFISEVKNVFHGHDPDFSMEPHSMSLAPNFRPGGITVYRQLLGLVTFKDKQAKQEALAAADKLKSDDQADEQTVPRVSVEAKDTTDVVLLTQLAEAELRQNLQNSEEQFKAHKEHSKSQHNNVPFFANYRVVAAKEQVQRATKRLRHRQREHRQAADELEQAKRKEPAYNVRWKPEGVAADTAEEISTNGKESHQWQVFVNDETALRASVVARSHSSETSGEFFSSWLNTPAPVAGIASVVGRRLRDSNTVALCTNLRAQVIRILRNLDDSIEEQKSNATLGEDEIRQMEQNVADDGIDWEALRDASTLPTLLKYTVVPAARAKICKQLVQIAAEAEDLPEQNMWSALLTESLQIDSSGSCPAESMQLMAALSDWYRRLAPVGRTALHVATMQGHHDVCRLLLENKADPDIRDSANGITALGHAACAEADLDTRCAIAKSCAKVTASAFDDLSGSSSAEVDRVRAKHAVELEKLRSEAAQLKGKRRVASQLTALLRGESIDNCVISTTAEAISTGATHSAVASQMKFASLQAAAARGDCACIANQLCKFPQRLNQQDSRGFTLLHWASRNGSADVVQLLVGRGAEVNKTNNAGQTALHCAKGDVVAQILLNAGANYLALDADGQSAAQALRGAIHESVPDATAADLRGVRADTSGGVKGTEEVANDAGQEQQQQQKKKNQQNQQGRLEQRKRRIAERQRTLNMANDAALQRRAKKAGKLAATVAAATGAASAAGHRAATEQLLKTRMSGRMQRAREAMNMAPVVQQQPHQHESARAEALFSRARESISAKDYDSAVVVLDEALRIRPDKGEIKSMREQAACEALVLKMEMLLQHSRFEEAAKAARAVLQRDPSDAKVEQWLQRAVAGLWAKAKEAGEKLDKNVRLKASAMIKQQRQQQFGRLDPVGTIEGRRTHIVGCNYAVLVDQQFQEMKHACEVLQRKSDRAHCSVRNAMAPPLACGDDDRAALRVTEILKSLWETLTKELREAEQAVAAAVAAFKLSDSDEAKGLVKSAIELKRKAREALCNAVGELPAPGIGQRKPGDYKQDLEAALAHAAKNVVDAKMTADERKEFAKIDRDIAQHRLKRIEMLTVSLKVDLR